MKIVQFIKKKHKKYVLGMGLFFLIWAGIFITLGGLGLVHLTVTNAQGANTIYIDPTYTGSNGIGNGSIERPYDAWTDITSFQNDTSYLQKKGTTYTSATQIFLNSKDNITIGTYGSGARPLFSYLGGGYAIRIELSDNILVQGFEIDGNAGAHSLIGLNHHATINPSNHYFINNRIDDCVLHNAHNPNNAGFGIHASYNDGLKITNTTIYNVAVDGIYTSYEPNIEIGYCTIYDVNRRYFEPGKQDQIYSNGDGIQLDGYWNGFHIHHTTVDRTNGARNKFNVILNSAGSSAYASGILEYNTFVTDSNIFSALHIEHGSGIITRYNTFKGVTIGLTIGTGAFNNIIHNNIFYDCSRGISFGWNSIKPNPDKIYNNVFYDFSATNTVNGDRYPPAHIFIQLGSNVEIKNNIHVRTTDVAVSLHKWANAGTTTISNNCYGTLATASFSGANAVIANPLFVNGPMRDFHLQNTSPCINAGIDVGLYQDFDGIDIPQYSIPDIGAFEYSSGLVFDYVPNSFSFTDVVGAEINTLYTSNIVTLSGMSPNVFTGITTTAGYMLKNGINIGQSGTGANDDQFVLALTSSNNYSTVISSTMTIAGVSDVFSVTTKVADYIPNAFSFTDVVGAEVNTLYTSNIVTIDGMSPNVFTGISVNVGYMLKNGINIGQSGTGANDDQFVLALTSSNNYSTVISSTMTIAGVSDVFSLTTKAYIDTTKPLVTSFIIPTSATGLTITISSFTATDNIGVSGYLITESASVPSTGNVSWTPSPRTNFTFSSTGSKTLYARAKDAVGNISTGVSDTINITLPVITDYYISLSGSDSGATLGDISHPRRSLAYACDHATTSGNTIHINSGVYIETSPCNLAVGVSIEGEGITSVIKSHYVTPNTNTFNTASISLISTASTSTNGNQSISNLKLDGDNLQGSAGILIKKRSNVKVHDVTIVDFFKNGIAFWGPSAYNTTNGPFLYDDGNELYDSIITNCGDIPGAPYIGGGLILMTAQSNLLIHDNILTANSRAQGHNGNIINGGGRHFKGVKYYNNISYKPDYEGIDFSSGTYNGDPTGWNFHIEVWQNEGGFEVYNNQFYGGDCAIDAGGGDLDNGASHKGDYDYSWSIHDNFFQPISGHGVNTYHGKAAIDIESFYTEDVLVYNNHFKDFPRPIAIGDSPSTYCEMKRISIYNNLIENAGWGSGRFSYVISVAVERPGNVTSDIYIHNNTIVSDVTSRTMAFLIEAGSDGSSSGGTLNNINIKNNIMVNHTNGAPIFITNNGAINGLHIENNLSYNLNNYNILPYFRANNIGTLTDYTYLNNIPTSNTTQQNPLFISSTDFHLQAGSPAINAGTGVGLPYSGSAPDIGTFEYTSGIVLDYIPNAFTFTDVVGAEVNMLYTSNIVTLSGMSSGVFTGITVNAGYMLKNGISIGQSGTGTNGDQFILALTSSNNYSTVVISTMTIAGVSDVFSLTTKAADYIPNAFTFSPINGASVNTLYTSNIIFLSGMSSGVFTGISVNSGYLLKNGINIGQSGTGGNGDQFTLALTSSVNYSTIVSSLMTIAGVTGSFSITTQAADYIPNAFLFTDVTGAEINILYTSNIVTLSGMSSGISTGVSVNSGYLLKNGTNIGQSGTGANGDQFVLALTSSNNYSTPLSATMTIAGISDIFSLTTKAADYIPNAFSFTDVTGAEINMLYTSNIVTLSGISFGVFTGITVNAGYMLKNGINIGQSGTGANGDQFILALTSSNNYSTVVISTMTIAGVSDVFSLTTKAADYIPNAFSFTPINGATLNTLYTSNIVTLSGMSSGISTGVSVNSGYLLKNGINIGQSGTGTNGDNFVLALTSSVNYSTVVSSIMTIAGISGGFSITTQNNPSYPTILGVTSGSYYSGNVYIYLLSGTNYSGMWVNGVWYTSSGFTISGVANSLTQYYLTAYNTNGNYSTIHFSIDTAAPVTTDNGTTPIASGDQTITLDAHDNGIGLGNTRYCIDTVGGTCTPTIIGTNISVAGISGSLIQKIVRYFSIDLLGNTESIKTSNTITIDQQAPQNIGFTVNSGSMYTTGTNILLTYITGIDSWSPLQIAYGTSLNIINWTGWTATKTRTLDNENGLKTIFMKFRDAGGNISITSGIIILDTIFPIITLYNPNTTPSYSKTISGSTQEGILYQAITTGMLCDGSLTFSPYHVLTFSGEADNGKKLCYKAVDLAGNTSYSMSNSIQGIDRTNPVVSTIYPNSGLIITGTSSMTFLRSGFDITLSGYTLYVNGSGYATTGTSYTVNTMANGVYTWYVLATDQAGNTGTSVSPGFTLTTSLSGTATISNIYYSGYTNTTFPINVWTNISAQFSITGDITGAIILPYTGSVNPIVTHFLELTPGDGNKTIYITFLTGNQTYTIHKSIILDTTAPNIPILGSPISGGITSGAFTLNRSAVVDTGVGLSGYQYFVSTTGTLGTGIVSSGFTPNTYVSITNLTPGTSERYYWYIKAIDRLGNSGTSLAQSFTYNQGYDTIPNIFSLNTIYDASRNTRYGSTTITISGLSVNTPVLASINTGSLYISGNMVGTGGYVQNGWTVRIQLVSSSYYNHLITSTLTIGGISSNFAITTQTEDDEKYTSISSNLSTTEKIQIISIFKTLRDVYVGTKQDEFLDSFMLMLQSRIETLETRTNTLHTRNALHYLYYLVEQYRSIEHTNNIHGAAIVDGIYTAPNGKEYIITYDDVRKQFTSANFTTPKYFPTLDILKYTIDIANPVGSIYVNAKAIKARWGRIQLDGTRQASPYTAPNHKVFYFFKTMEGQYSSYTFTTEKYFSDLASLKEHIYTRNLR